MEVYQIFKQKTLYLEKVLSDITASNSTRQYSMWWTQWNPQISLRSASTVFHRTALAPHTGFFSANGGDRPQVWRAGGNKPNKPTRSCSPVCGLDEELKTPHLWNKILKNTRQVTKSYRELSHRFGIVSATTHATYDVKCGPQNVSNV
jgi:hypothetical protein